MSHFIRCDRCDKQDVTMGTLSLPPGWQNILHSDLCEPCCLIVRDFIRFKLSDAANLPIEPIEQPAVLCQASEQLFETAPATQVSADSHQESDQASDGKVVPDHATVGEPTGQTQPVSAESKLFDPASEATTTEKQRTRKHRGQDAVLGPDLRKPQPGAPA